MDEATLAQLFNTSLVQWGIGGHCAPAADAMLGVEIQLQGGSKASLFRDTTTGSRLPVWRLQLDDRRPMEAGSLRVILHILRTELDPDYRPAKVIIGVQPEMALTSSTGR